MDKEKERKLVEQAQKSLHAFSELYDYYLPRIYRYSLNRVGNVEIAEDLTSKTFLKAMKNLGGFKYTVSFSAWLYRIAHNTIIDFYRTNRKYSISVEAIENFLSSDKRTEEAAEKAELSKKILEILKKLPAPYQEILSLRFFEEKNNSEIAEILDCSTNNVAVKMHRALNSYAKLVRKHSPDLLEFL